MTSFSMANRLLVLEVSPDNVPSPVRMGNAHAGIQWLTALLDIEMLEILEEIHESSTFDDIPT